MSHLDPKFVRYARNRAADIRQQEFARSFVAWLDRSGVTRKEVMFALGVHSSSVAHWVTGQAMPSHEHLEKLRAMGFPGSHKSA